MSGILVIGSYIVLLVLLTKLNDRMRGIEGELRLARIDIV